MVLYRREFMYASDLADAIFRAANNIDTLPELMNCGLGYDYSINEYYKTVADVIGWEECLFMISRNRGMRQNFAPLSARILGDGPLLPAYAA